MLLKTGVPAHIRWKYHRTVTSWCVIKKGIAAFALRWAPR